jgi:hypothetical protein
MRGSALLVLAVMGCGAHAPAPTKPAETRAEVAPRATASTAPTQIVEDGGLSPISLPHDSPSDLPAPPLNLDGATLYTISVDSVPVKCQAWKRDDETDEYRWSRKAAGQVHVQRLGIHARALSFTDERHHADGSISATTCDVSYEDRVDDEVAVSTGKLFLTAKACAGALANQERVAFNPLCSAPTDEAENGAVLAKFIKLASRRGTMYVAVPTNEERTDSRCELVRLAGNAPNADGWTLGEATYARAVSGKRIAAISRYRLSVVDQLVLMQGLDGREEGVRAVDGYIQTFDNFYFTLAACKAQVERAKWGAAD